MNKQKQLIVYVIASLVIAAIPIISWPLNWIETYFHEMSHGIVAILTGGQVEQIVIRIDGSGYCEYRGGARGITAFSGYLGAIIAGSTMYLSARLLNKNATVISYLMMAFITITAVLYARDIITIVILVTLLALFYFSSSNKFSKYFNRVEELIGIYVLTNAIRSPLHLFDGRNIGDGATLSDLTFIPEFLWVTIWVALGVSALIFLWRLEGKNNETV